jgi:hypothetical protein
MKMSCKYLFLAAACWLSGPGLSFGAAGLKSLPGHLPSLPAGLTAFGPLPETNQLRLAIGLPLRDSVGLDAYLAQLYDPASTNYQHYLSPGEFTQRFGPTAEDYQAVVDFAGSNHLSITALQGNRLLLDVIGSAADVQSAFHITLEAYHHPTENRDFYAPDREPSVEGQLAIADVSGLSNYQRPHPLVRVRSAAGKVAGKTGTGSGSGGAFIGNDFRAAYLPGTTLTGAGQLVGLVQFDGFYASDIKAYAAAAGLPTVPIQTVLLDNYDGNPTTGANSGNVEVSLDIEMVMSMAPGLAKIIVFEAGSSGNQNDILNAMAASNSVKQLSCSWGWSGGPSTTTDAIFKEMAAQGQSFFSASGDSDAFTTGANSANGVDNTSLDNTPSSCPYITVVGGTALTTTGPGGDWSSETVWNWGLHKGSYVGSSGGISSSYSLPTWQSGVSMAANGGSTSYRNTPDVAMVADNVFVLYGDGSSETVGGTSCAAPLWAGLTALINQQATSSGRTNVGFLNPALYALGEGFAYNRTFHDITTGSNTWSDSPSLFYAASGYDLCTGWGTPVGQVLINALSGVANWLGVLPGNGFTATGPYGGAFRPNTTTLTLTNSGSSPLAWSLVNTSSWLTASSSSGSLSAGGTALVSASVTAAASDLTPGIYTASLLATNRGAGVIVPFTLSIGQSLIQNGGFETGSFDDWTFSGNTVIGSDIYNAVESSSSQYTVAHSGKYGAFLGDTKLALLAQSFSTVPGQYYWVSLWLDNPTSGSGQRFLVNWVADAATNTLDRLENPSAFSWINLQFLVQATDTNSTLAIEAENAPAYFGLDDVSVLPVPSPEFVSLEPSGNSVQLSWLASTGLVYQVQYETNLAQGNWLNLNAASTASSFNGSVLDTNALTTAPSHYYRLKVAP